MTIGEAAQGAGAEPPQAAWAGLVGRADVLAQLGRAIEDAAGGRGRLVLLTGEAGIGKTSVAAQAAADAEAAGARVVWGWGWQGEGAPAYWPWVQVLRSLVAQDPHRQRLAADAPSLARLLPELPEAAPPPAADEPATAAARFRLLDEVSAVLLAAAGDRPLVVVLEDLQWADPPSLQLLDFLARRLPAARALVLATWRDLDTAPDDPAAPLLAELAARATVVPLPALTEPEVARLVGGMLGRPPEPALVADLRRRTGGNPFFVQQVTRLLAAQAGGPGQDAPAGIPLGVREAIRRRLARLGRGCAELVTAAAVAGPECTAALLARVTGAPPEAVPDLLEEAARAHVLAGPDGPLRPWRFAHDLFRESILEDLDGPAKARLHLAVGRALEAEGDSGGVPPAQLASHFAQAGPGAADEAVRYGALAAAEATRRLAHEEAARLLARALEALDGSARADGRRRTELLGELAAARRRAGDLAGSRQACQRATELARRAGDPDGLARAALAMQAVGTRSWPTLVQDTVPLLEEAAAALGDQDTPLRARVLAGLARELAWNGLDVARAARFADAAMATARAAGDPATLAACLLARHNAGWGPGDAADRLALATQVAELAGEARDLELLAEARLLRAADLLELGDPSFAAELAEFLRVAADLEQPRLRSAALARRAMQALLAGRHDEGERLVAEAAALSREIGEPDAADVELAQLWDLRGLQGRRGELLPLVRALFPEDSPPGRYFLATILLEDGDRAGAEAVAAPMFDLTAPSALPADRIWLTSVAFASELAAALGTPAACRWLYDALLPHADGTVVVGVAIAFRGAVAHYLGLLAAALDRPEEARAHFERALAVHERLGARTWAARSRQALAGDRGPAAGQAPGGGGVFRRDGTLWTLTWAGRTVRMRDAKGLRDLAALLAAPGRPVPAAELVAAAAGEAAVPADLRLGADEVLDDRARHEIRSRLLDLEEEIEEADRWHDQERAARAATERDALVAELAAAAGLGGRARRLGDQSERARKTVTARIRDVLDRVERLHPALGAHLRASVTTGTFCSYSPPAPTVWEL
jgi:tetratricopeptide (TPR) repeat protein